MRTVKLRVMICLLGSVWLTSCDESGEIVDPEKNSNDPLKQVDKIIAEVENVGKSEDQTAAPEDPATEPGTAPEIPVAQPVPDKPGFVISPYNGKWIDVTEMPAGEVVADPGFKPDEKKFFRVPAAAVEKTPVPESPADSRPATAPGGMPDGAGSAGSYPEGALVAGKPNFVFSPYNNELIDVTGLPAGSLVADPKFPESEKKFFRVPALQTPAEDGGGQQP